MSNQPSVRNTYGSANHGVQSNNSGSARRSSGSSLGHAGSSLGRVHAGNANPGAGAGRPSGAHTRAGSASAAQATNGTHKASTTRSSRSASSSHSARPSGNTHDASTTRSSRANSSSRPTHSSHTGSPATQTSQEEKPKRKKGRYIPALDGLRAVAVLGVIAYHMGLNWAPGGLLGVTVFFVLSGYLITSLLLIEWDSTGTIDLPQFWLRRVRRLFPAIAFVIIGVAVLTTIFDHSLLTKLREDMWAALCWVTNWWYILRDVSYFDALGAPSPVTHFWSLAIEEQFYVVWPIVLILAHKFGVKRTHMRNATLVLALASAIEMAVLFDPSADPSRVYYGTDTRAFSLLIGAWLAFVWPSNQLGAEGEVQLDRTVRLILDAVGAAALIGLLAMMGTIEGTSAFMYRGGIFLASIITMVIIAVIVHPSSVLARVFALKPFVKIGVLSYSIYLWHYPILLLMNPRSNIEGTPWWMYIIELVIIVAISAFSYKFIEDPLRKGALGRFVKGLRSGEIVFGQWVRERIIPVAAGSLLTLVAIGGLIFVPNTSALEAGDILKDESAHVAGTVQKDQAKLDILMIGDSVSVRAIPNFTEKFPYGLIDAAVNRRLDSGLELYQSYANQNVVGDVVVFALGTNGLATDEELDTLVGAVGSDKHIFFVNTRSSTTWMDDTNAALQSAAERYNNVQVIDWYSYSASNGDWFDGDGTHLSEEGAQVYIDLIYDSVKSLLPEHNANDEAVEVKTPVEDAGEKVSTAVEATVKSLAETVATNMKEQPKK